MKKRTTSLILAFVLLFTVCGCGKGKTTSEYTEFESVIDTGINDNSANSNNSGSNGSDTGNKGNSNNGNTVVAEKPKKAATSATDTSGHSAELANPIYIAEGNTAMDSNLNFGGKTFKMAKRTDSLYTTGKFKRLIASFEKKYNCKIDAKELDFNEYSTLLSNAKASGDPYDIIFCHGSRFPEIPLSGVVTDLSQYLTTADYDTGKGGIDIVKSSYFAKDKNLYGVVGGEDAVHPIVIFYNKLMFSKNGLEDPYELYKAGKWTWSKLREQGKKVTDASKNLYYGNFGFAKFSVVHSLGVPLMTWKNNKVVLNTSDSNVTKGFQLLYDLFNTSKIFSQDHSNDIYKTFAAGNSFCTMEESQKYSLVCGYAADSAAFNRDASNVGIVPLPQDSASAKRGYPCGWYTAVMAGSGTSDPRVAVAFAKFWSTYTDPVKDKYELSDDYKALVKKLTSGNITNLHGGYTGSDGSASYVYFNYPICMDIALGSDISSTVASNLPKIQACVDYTLKK